MDASGVSGAGRRRSPRGAAAENPASQPPAKPAQRGGSTKVSKVNHLEGVSYFSRGIGRGLENSPKVRVVVQLRAGFEFLIFIFNF